MQRVTLMKENTYFGGIYFIIYVTFNGCKVIIFKSSHILILIITITSQYLGWRPLYVNMKMKRFKYNCGETSAVLFTKVPFKCSITQRELLDYRQK